MNCTVSLLAVGVGILAMSLSAMQAQAVEGGVKAAAGKVEITPTRPAYMAGYGADRRSTGAHDALSARCLVLESGGVRIAFVSCDVIGVPRRTVAQIRAAVKSVPPERLYIAATHTHSGPDTLGQWGPNPRTSGVDQEWLAAFREKVANLVEETASRLKPAVIRFARTTDVPRISKNIRVPRILDTELAVMQVAGKEDGKPIATFVNYACHPEILDNHLLTADFPHWLYATVEAKGGGVCLYLNGAQGGMVTADYDETTAPKGENWQAAERIGTDLANRALDILANAPAVETVPITTQQRVFRVPMENKDFLALIQVGVFPKDSLENGHVVTEVNRITVGPAEFLTLPGEVLPNIGFYLKRLMRGSPKFLLGLCCDELGYILSQEDYGLDLYAYETRVSVGSLMGPRMEENLRALLPDTNKSVQSAVK